jgi:hypothetical protein
MMVLMAAVGSLSPSGIGMAQSKPTSPPAPSSPQEKDTEPVRAAATVITGTVTLVDAKAGTLRVKTKDREITLTADAESTKSALQKLKTGDTARIFERGGKVIAVSPVEAGPNAKTPR